VTSRFDRSSYADPNGRLEGLALNQPSVRRELLPHYQNLAGTLLANPYICDLMERRQLVSTRIAAGVAASPTVLEHDVVWPLTFPGEWLGEMLADAGLLILDIASAVATEGFELQDGTPRNVVFSGARPVFVDFTSIVRRKESPYWRAFDQFAREVLHPQLLCGWGLQALWRHAAFARPREGISAGDVCRVMPMAFRLKRPVRAATLHGMARLEQRPSTSSAPLLSTIRPVSAQHTSFHLKRLFSHLRREVQRLRAKGVRARGPGWRDYYASDVDPEGLKRKTQVIRDLVQRTRPQTVLDLGANTGEFSLLAAELGARVVAADVDESSLSELYREAARRGLPVTPVVMDAVCPTPAFGLGGVEYPPATERLRSDLTIALGLVHHLVARNDYTLERLADALGAYGSRTLALEFIGPNDPRAQALSLGLRPWYTLDACREAVGRHFPQVETIHLSGERSLIIGSRT
jgi:hypothetical protein